MTILAPPIPSAAQSATLAEWTYTYAHSGNIEHDRLYRDGDTLYYEQSDNGLTVTHPFTVATIRRVTLWESNDELDVQVWAPHSVSLLVLHFNKSQRGYAQQIADRIERLRY